MTPNAAIPGQGWCANAAALDSPNLGGFEAAPYAMLSATYERNGWCATLFLRAQEYLLGFAAIVLNSYIRRNVGRAWLHRASPSSKK